uniref:Sensory/regulatory protein RpfC n=1 Tax=Desulfovibrio sp. U5L TaxID=596152 RepID=I2PZZ5_9BACT
MSPPKKHRPTETPERQEPSPLAPKTADPPAIDETIETPNAPPVPIVAIGASVDDLEAIETFFARMPPDSGAAFILVEHLSPEHSGLMPERVGQATKMATRQAAEGLRVAPDTVYTMPPGKELLIRDGILHLAEPERPRGHNRPIDRFFSSLAMDQKENAVCILLPGTGSDGTLSLKTVQEFGGITLAQNSDTRFADRLQSAMPTGVVDYALVVQEMPETIVKLLKHRPNLPVESQATVETMEKSEFIKKILRKIKLKRGHDFSWYKPNTVARRIARRMALLQIPELQDYLAYIKNNDAEIKMLFQELLIGVTNFFRDEEAFEVLARTVISKIITGKPEAETIRFWVAGCSTGEEAYSLAMLLAEQMSRNGKTNRVQIFATDIDEESLEVARHGLFPAAIEAHVSPERLGRFFSKEGPDYRVVKSLREMIVFAPHSLIRDPPYSHIDCISCRNLLIYLSPDLQKKVLPMFHYSLNPQGFLFLGPSESVTEQMGLFETVDRKWKIFQAKANTPAKINDIPFILSNGQQLMLETSNESCHADHISYIKQAQQLIVTRFSAPSVVINDRYEPLTFFGPVNRYFEVTAGESTKSILLLAKESLRPYLRSTLHTALRENQPVRRDGLRLPVDGKIETVNLVVMPLWEDERLERLFLVAFEHVGWSGDKVASHTIGPTADCEVLIKSLEQELNAAKTELQTMVQELEAANEELKSSNEELMSMNEELQSSNEELETSREELHSINEELTSLNSEMQHKFDDLCSANSDLQNFINSSRIATLFLDRNLTIRRFTPQVMDFFNILDVDIGRPFAHLRSRIDYKEIFEDIHHVLETLMPLERQLVGQSDQRILTRVIPYRSINDRIDGVVLTFMDVTSAVAAEKRLSQQTEELETLYKTIPDIYFKVAPDGAILNCRSTHEPDIIPDAALVAGRHFSQIFGPEHGATLEEAMREAREADAQRSLDLHFVANGKNRHLEVRIVPVAEETFVIMRDMTGLKQAEDRLRFQADVLSQVSDALIAVDEAGSIILWNPGAERILEIPAERALGQPLEAFTGIKWIMADDAAADRPGDQRLWIKEFDHVRADGSHIVVESSVSVLRDTRGNRIGLLAILRDVSDNKRFAKELLEAKQKAELANRTKSEFLANMSHEIRTPMNGILGMTQLALNRDLPDDVREFLQLVHQSGQSLLDIINDILDLSKIEAGRVVLEQKPFDLVEMVESTLKPLELLARDKGLTFLFSIAPDVPDRVVGDKGRLRQILTNMVGNAIKFTKRGRVEVKVCQAEAREPGKASLLFLIKDEGIGISKAQIHSIFEKFEQIASSAHVQYGGTGLGLAISKALVEMMGGMIQVESELHKGSTFSFILTLGKVAEIETTPRPPLPANQGGIPPLKILLVEDNQVNSLFASHILQSWGHTVEIANNGRQAVETLKTREFDLVLMDALMPVMDGEQATRLIRSGQAGNPDIPIVAQTAYALQGDRERFLSVGMNDYISKPLNLDELKRVLGRVMEAKKDRPH